MTNARGPAMARVAEAMLRALGGGEVRLLLPVVRSADAGAQQLGLASGDLEEAACSPVVGRTLDSNDGQPQYEFLFSASALLSMAEIRGIDQPESLFTVARGLLHGEARLRIRKVAVEYLAGTPYLYRVTAE